MNSAYMLLRRLHPADIRARWGLLGLHPFWWRVWRTARMTCGVRVWLIPPELWGKTRIGDAGLTAED